MTSNNTSPQFTYPISFNATTNPRIVCTPGSNASTPGDHSTNNIIWIFNVSATGFQAYATWGSAGYYLVIGY